MRPERSGTPSPESMRPSAKGLRRKRHRHADHRRGARAGLGPEDGPPAVVAAPRGASPGSQDRDGERTLRRRRAGRQDRQDGRRRAPAAAQEQERGKQEDRGGRPPPRDRRGLLSEEKRDRGLLRHREGRDPVGRDRASGSRRSRGRPGRGPSRTSPRRRVSARGSSASAASSPPRLRSSAEVRQLSPAQHLLDDLRVHAVESEDHDRGRAPRPRAAPRGGRTESAAPVSFMRRPQFSKSRAEPRRAGTALESGAWRRGPRTWRRCSRGYRIARSGPSSRPSSSCAPSTSIDSRSSSCCASATSSGSIGTLAGGVSSASLVSERGFAPRAEIPVRWFFRKLEAGRIPGRRGGRRRRPSTARAARFRRAIPIARRPGPARSIPGRCRPSRSSARWSSTWPAFLRGEKTGEEILFAPAKLPLWFDYFSNDNLLYQINNRLGAEAVARVLPATAPGRGPRDRRRLGSAALAVAERLARDGALPRIERYVFTEIVPTFLRRAERTIRARYPSFPAEFLQLDMDRDFAEPGRAARESPTSCTRSTPCTSPATSPQRSARIREALEARRRRGFLGVRPALPRPADLRRVRLQLPGELHGRRDGLRDPPEPRLPDPGELARGVSSGRLRAARAFSPTSRSSRVTTTRSSWRRSGRGGRRDAAAASALREGSSQNG